MSDQAVAAGDQGVGTPPESDREPPRVTRSLAHTFIVPTISGVYLWIWCYFHVRGVGLILYVVAGLAPLLLLVLGAVVAAALASPETELSWKGRLLVLMKDRRVRVAVVGASTVLVVSTFFLATVVVCDPRTTGPSTAITFCRSSGEPLSEKTLPANECRVFWKLLSPLGGEFTLVASDYSPFPVELRPVFGPARVPLPDLLNELTVRLTAPHECLDVEPRGWFGVSINQGALEYHAADGAGALRLGPAPSTKGVVGREGTAGSSRMAQHRRETTLAVDLDQRLRSGDALKVTYVLDRAGGEACAEFERTVESMDPIDEELRVVRREPVRSR